MKDFPQESIEKARSIVDSYKQRSTSKREIAANLYDNRFLEIAYGFTDSIKSGNCGRYLHEIKKDADCFTMVGVLYLIAREAGLNPQMYLAYGMKDVKEGTDSTKKGALDHSFITVSVGKNKTYLVDPQMSLFGEATFNSQRNTIKVYNRRPFRLTQRQYATMQKMSEQEYLTKLEENRSPEGGKLVLSTTQRINGARGNGIHISYLPETHELRSSLHLELPIFGPEPYSRSSITDLVTPVNKDGSFDLKKGNFHFYNAVKAGWSEHENPQVPLIFPAQEAIRVWDVWEDIMSKLGRKSSISHMNSAELVHKIQEAGFRDDFKFQDNSFAKNLVSELSLEKKIKQIQNAQKKSIAQFVPQCKLDEISYKTLLRDAQYIAQTDKNRINSDKDIYGFIFSKAEHEKLFLESFKGFKRRSISLARTAIDCTRMAVGLKKGNKYLANRKFNATHAREVEETQYFDAMASMRKMKFSFVFNIFADEYLFARNLNLEERTVSELEKNISQRNLERAAQKRLFVKLTQTVIKKEALFLESYKKGLQKILSSE